METTAGEVGTNGNALITENLKHASQRKQLKWAKGSKNAEAVIYKVPLRNTPVHLYSRIIHNAHLLQGILDIHNNRSTVFHKRSVNKF